jgi:protein-tyrosine-phosphatase
MTPTPQVVFVCLHGAAKSVVAAALLERLAARAGVPVRALARGLEPDPALAPAAVEGLRREGLDVGGQTPTALGAGDLRGAARVVAFGCDLSGRVPPGVPVERWDDVPAVSDGFAAARDRIASRLPALLAACRAAAPGMARGGAPRS